MPVCLMRILTTVTVMAVLTLAVDLQAEESSGSWRGKWWNYYERAAAGSEAGDWQAAKADLLKALGLRDRDQRRARTYGMHFIDYFAHRELGIAYYHLGDLKRALFELETSHASVESAKCSFYLNAVRRKLLSQQATKPQPPSIKVDFPSPGQTFKDGNVTVRGHISAAGLLSSLTINGKPYRFDLAVKEMDFAMEVPLDDDSSGITVEAADLAGAVIRREIALQIDREGPTVSLSAISSIPGDGAKIRLSARVSDQSGIRSLQVNGVAVETAGTREFDLDTTLVPAPGQKTLHLEATDLLGNQTSLDLDSERENAAWLKRPSPVLLALNGPGLFTLDKEPPLITLKDSDDLPAVYIDRYYVEGDAFDNGKVERIAINGREIRISKGRKVFFSKMVKLKEGNNRITVEAFDSHGNRQATEFNVKRIVPSARQNSARLSMSVMPFNGRINNAALQDMADDFLVAALVDQKRFQVIEREKLKQILQEQKLAREKLTDPQHSIQVGRLLSADAILVTTIAEGQKSLEVISRMVSSETAEVLETRDAYLEDKSLAAVKDLMDGLAAKLALGFPVVEGLVVKKEKGTLFSDIGVASGVRKSMAVAVYRRGQEIRHPVTGKSLGWDMQKIGDGTFDDVQDGFSRVRLHDKSDPKQDIKVRDIIITR